jgi:hypothetical protein
VVRHRENPTVMCQRLHDQRISQRACANGECGTLPQIGPKYIIIMMICVCTMYVLTMKLVGGSVVPIDNC